MMPRYFVETIVLPSRCRRPYTNLRTAARDALQFSRAGSCPVDLVGVDGDLIATIDVGSTRLTWLQKPYWRK